jgi:hypothetical protein
LKVSHYRISMQPGERSEEQERQMIRRERLKNEREGERERERERERGMRLGGGEFTTLDGRVGYG